MRPRVVLVSIRSTPSPLQSTQPIQPIQPIQLIQPRPKTTNYVYTHTLLATEANQASTPLLVFYIQHCILQHPRLVVTLQPLSRHKIRQPLTSPGANTQTQKLGQTWSESIATQGLFVRRTPQDTLKSIDRVDRLPTVGEISPTVCAGGIKRGSTVASSSSFLTFERKRSCLRHSFFIIEGLFVIRQRSQGCSIKLQVIFPRRILPTLHAKRRLTHTPHTDGLALKPTDYCHHLANGTVTAAGVKFASLALDPSSARSLVKALYSSGGGETKGTWGPLSCWD